MNKENILKQILNMNLGENNTIELTNDKFLNIDNEENNIIIELHSGYKDGEFYMSEEVLERLTYNHTNRREMITDIMHILNI